MSANESSDSTYNAAVSTVLSREATFQAAIQPSRTERKVSITNSENPLLRASGLPAYDEIEPGHIAPAAEIILDRCRQVLREVESVDRAVWDDVMLPLEQIDELMEYGWAPVGHLMSVSNSEPLRVAHDSVMPAMVEASLEIRQSEPLYRQLRAIHEMASSQSLSGARIRILQRLIQSAEQSGIALSGADRDAFNRIEQKLAQLGADFSNHLLDATKAWYLDLTEPSQVEGLPESLRRIAAAAWSQAEENSEQEATAAAGPWRITLDYPCFGPFMEHCPDRALREQVYRAFITRASTGNTDNTPLIREILSLRKQKAVLLGYECYADLSLSCKMAEDQAAVQQMFDRLLQASHEAAKREMEELAEFAAERGHEGDLAHWDIAFWTERLREERYAFTEEELRPYFSLDRVLDGLFEICTRLFGVTFRRRDEDAPKWHPDVRYYEVFAENGDLQAGFYLDPFSRPQTKRGGAWMNDCIGRSVSRNGTRLPVAHLVCNSTPATSETPSLMTFREVETLFHEFGHGLQHMLTTIDDRDAAGINGVEWDAVELPSQFMEYWCLHRPTLMAMAKHYQTGETLPDDYYRKLKQSKTFRAASMMLRQLQLGMTDMMLHSSYDPDGSESPFDAERRILSITSLLPILPENRFLCSFQHIFAGGYAAGYYSYKWAELLSADAFSAFEEIDSNDDAELQRVGRRFRDTVLAEGGSRHPMQIFQDFRGREPDAESLLRHCGLTQPEATPTQVSDSR